jgi:hypothetical protein
MQAMKEKTKTYSKVNLNAVNAAVEIVAQSPSQLKIKTTKAQAKVATHASTVVLGELAQMEQSRMLWESKELVASNQRLYSILKRAYSFYKTLKEDENKDVRDARRKELERFIEDRKYQFGTTTHDMTRVVKCVFGVDRRRVSSYSIALREALLQKKSVDDLISFLEQEGGVEQIRMGGTKPLTISKRADAVKGTVWDTEIGDIKLNPKLIDADPEWNDKQVVILATYLPTGIFKVSAVVKHDGAVTAALSAYYTAQQAKVREKEKAKKDESEKVEAIFKSTPSRKIKSRSTTSAMEKQISKTKSKSEVMRRKEANLAHAKTLFEDFPA